MKRKLKLKKWVVYLLLTINMIAILFMGAECEDFKLFVTSKIIALGIFIINNLILAKYSDIFEEE